MPISEHHGDESTRPPADYGPGIETQPISYGRRNLSFAGLAVVVVAYLAIIKGIGALTTDRADLVDDVLATPSNVVWALVVPLGAAFVFVYGLITYLGWWPAVLHDPKPVQRWVWSVPIIFLVAIAFGINYGGLADRGLGFTLLLLVATQFVGWGEEGMFRCISVTTMRRHHWTEGRVALWSSAVFGAVHLTNALTTGTSALGQAVAVSFAGYFFYLIRRVSRSNVANSIIHGLFDFTILSGTAIIAKGDDLYLGASLAILVYVVVAILLLVRRHHIELN